MRELRWLLAGVWGASWLAFVGAWGSGLSARPSTPNGVPADPSGVTVRPGEVSFHARVDRAGFERELLGMPGYHLIVWEDGRAVSAALFHAEVSDTRVLEALESLGERPGNALPMATWDARKDAESRDPERIIAGPPVEILVEVPGRQGLLRLDQILQDPGGRGFAMRFGGHRANIPAWKSGCVVCLYSCPGSKIGNARYTVRDFMNKVTKFRVRPGVLPPDGTRVRIVLRTGAPTSSGRGSSPPHR